jgi:hypothetical protein
MHVVCCVESFGTLHGITRKNYRQNEGTCLILKLGYGFRRNEVLCSLFEIQDKFSFLCRVMRWCAVCCMYL